MPSWIIVSYLICSAAIIFAIVRLFARGNKPYAKAGVMVYLVYTLLFAAIWIFSLPVPSFLIFLTMLTALACCFCGYYLDLYNHSPYVFDRSLHAFGAFSFSLLLHHCGRNTARRFPAFSRAVCILHRQYSGCRIRTSGSRPRFQKKCPGQGTKGPSGYEYGYAV